MDTLRQAVPGGGDLEQSRVAWIALAAEDSSVPAARGFTTTTLTRWGLPAGDAGLVVTELASNAARAARAAGLPVILIRITPGQAIVMIEVGDLSGLLPAIAPRRPGQEHGMGLRLVTELASQAGWYTDGRWKIVWAALPFQTARRAARRCPRPAANHQPGRAA